MGKQRARRNNQRARQTAGRNRGADQREHDLQHDDRSYPDLRSDSPGSYADSNALATALGSSAQVRDVPGSAILPVVVGPERRLGGHAEQRS